VQGTDPTLVGNFANSVGASTIEYAQSLYGTFALVPLDEAGTPRRPIQPKAGVNLALGGVLGLVLGSGIALLTYFFQTSKKDANKFFDTEPDPEIEDIYESAVVELRQDITTLQEQSEAFGHVLNKIQSALRRTNSYARDIRSVVYELEERFDGNHSNVKEESEEPQ